MKSGFIYLADKVFPSLLAISHEEQATGLMWQAWTPPVMSFVYDKPGIMKFWMKNTPSPLDIVFTCNGEITQIHKGNPYSTAMIGDNMESDLIIELPLGTVESAGIKVGNKAGISDPTPEKLKNIIAEIRYGIRLP